MLLSELIGAVYGAGYDFKTAQEVRRYLVERSPKLADDVFDQPLSTAQADPIIPDKVGFQILEKLDIQVEGP